MASSNSGPQTFIPGIPTGKDRPRVMRAIVRADGPRPLSSRAGHTSDRSGLSLACVLRAWWIQGPAWDFAPRIIEYEFSKRASSDGPMATGGPAQGNGASNVNNVRNIEESMQLGLDWNLENVESTPPPQPSCSQQQVLASGINGGPFGQTRSLVSQRARKDQDRYCRDRVDILLHGSRHPSLPGRTGRSGTLLVGILLRL
jgi:hypothetical protein